MSMVVVATVLLLLLLHRALLPACPGQVCACVCVCVNVSVVCFFLCKKRHNVASRRWWSHVAPFGAMGKGGILVDL